MAADDYKLKEKSDTELHDWVCNHDPDTAEYKAGVLESMRRVAIIEETLEENENPSRKRELIAAFVAISAIIIIIISILLFGPAG